MGMFQILGYNRRAREEAHRRVSQLFRLYSLHKAGYAGRLIQRNDKADAQGTFMRYALVKIALLQTHFNVQEALCICIRRVRMALSAHSTLWRRRLARRILSIRQGWIIKEHLSASSKEATMKNPELCLCLQESCAQQRRETWLWVCACHTNCIAIKYIFFLNKKTEHCEI